MTELRECRYCFALPGCQDWQSACLWQHNNKTTPSLTATELGKSSNQVAEQVSCKQEHLYVHNSLNTLYTILKRGKIMKKNLLGVVSKIILETMWWNFTLTCINLSRESVRGNQSALNCSSSKLSRDTAMIEGLQWHASSHFMQACSLWVTKASWRLGVMCCMLDSNSGHSVIR